MIARSCGTHDGTFHADEVMACALLLFVGLIDRDKIVRTRDLQLLNKCEYVCDVGGVYDPSLKRFDHHQVEYTGPLSSAGMIWLYLKEQKKIDEPFYDFLNQNLIMGIDAHDNGKSPQLLGWSSFSHVITNFLPIEYEASAEAFNRCFYVALDFSLAYVERLEQRFRFLEGCKEKVKSAMESGKRYLVFDEALPWMENFFSLGGEKHPAQFLVMPSGSHWKLRTIPPSLEKRMEVRTPLPSAWAGLLEKEFKKVSKLPGGVFCHKGRFISVWETKADAMRALEYVLQESL